MAKLRQKKAVKAADKPLAICAGSLSPAPISPAALSGIGFPQENNLETLNMYDSEADSPDKSTVYR